MKSIQDQNVVPQVWFVMDCNGVWYLASKYFEFGNYGLVFTETNAYIFQT